MPPAVVTVTSTVPAVPAGLVTTICVAVLPVNRCRRRVPKYTAVALARFVPVIVTVVPPAGRPDVGTDARHRRRGHVGELIGRRGGRRAAGRDHRHVHRAGRARRAGDHDLRGRVADESSPRSLPNFTAVALARSVPVIVTVVPPAAGPAVGLMPVTVGAGT